LSDKIAFAKAIKTFADMENETWQQYRHGALALAAEYQQNLDAERSYNDLFKIAESNQQNEPDNAIR
jgi:hypothetical protein